MLLYSLPDLPGIGFLATYVTLWILFSPPILARRLETSAHTMDSDYPGRISALVHAFYAVLDHTRTLLHESLEKKCVLGVLVTHSNMGKECGAGSTNQQTRLAFVMIKNASERQYRLFTILSKTKERVPTPRPTWPGRGFAPQNVAPGGVSKWISGDYMLHYLEC